MADITIIEGADPAAIAAWLARKLEERLSGAGAITIPGGSTPFPILAALIEAGGVHWAAWQVWPNDDRIVPEDHEASNTGKMRALLEPAGAGIVPLVEDARPPHFALTWLGMGPDGHIASLFPNTDPQIDEPRAVLRLTPNPLPPHAPFDRITLTIPALLDTDALVFTLGGAADKRAVFEGAVAGAHDLPVARLLRAAAARGVPVTVFT
ncbi:6-phosphogluconolactonase [Porphyrobacter sp. HT-58-2]|uniref:6-phosphogluconolactonase n=1 Tax=Porphyrobacter sp. HT-58-2 TaxID=2023229 RepID=UPI000CDC53DE|nr:6-phosphogluconolactonase [Porphyrobacter sp. HT-58-2]AUX69034.1 6-phosphogluconolactonase [Porphyrobacter sp. HT-58-2]